MKVQSPFNKVGQPERRDYITLRVREGNLSFWYILPMKKKKGDYIKARIYMDILSKLDPGQKSNIFERNI